MELWNRIAGTVSLELTDADPERQLDRLARQGISVWDVERPSMLCVTFRLRRGQYLTAKEIVEKSGGKLIVVRTRGLIYQALQWRKRPILIGTVLLLLAASVYVPECVLFVQVEGNQTVPTRLILETAAQHGLSFGVSRRDVRSEQLKNELIGAIDSLEWVGVNTTGCVATISVREGQSQPVENRDRICNLVASADGVIDGIFLSKGTLLCQQGQAVRAGQLLVSGYRDLGICTRAMEAQAEIYALTRRVEEAVLPAVTLRRGEQVGEACRFSLVVGKKRINLCSDSRILPATCGKMTQVIPLRLPGGWTLPVCLVVERYIQCETDDIIRREADAAAQMVQAANRELLRESIACEILSSAAELELRDECYILRGRYECREMIARQEMALNMEGDTKDDPENGERGAG